MQVRRLWGGLLALVLVFVGLVAVPVQASAAETSVEVTFKPLDSVAKEDYGKYSIWRWPAPQGEEAVSFTGENEKGELTVTLHSADDSGKISFLVRRSDGVDVWAAQSQDIEVPAGKKTFVRVEQTDGNKDWLVTQSEEPGSNPEPNPGGDAAPGNHSVEITLHYVRYDEKYDGWNVWTWLPGADGSSRELVGGSATWTMDSDKPIDKVGIILRRSEGTNDWAEKNTEGDLFITKFEDGKAEVWIAQGNPTVYYSKEDVPAEPDLSCHELHSKDFNDKYTFDGELGAIYTPQSTTFRLWAPTAKSVSLVNYSNKGELIPMKAGEKGTWQYVFEGDADGVQYNYRLTFKDGTVDETPDPYAVASTANSTRSVVVDIDNVNPEGWTKERVPSFTAMRDAVIYEAHVRDLTIAPNNGIANKGKFLGLTEEGTRTEEGNLSGLDYIKSLGVTHVQFLPMYDFYTVDETGDLGYDKQYNWGYDPVNYNVPEGSYSTDPTDPESRIVEMKEMIDAIHDAGMYVVMDVVYNHVYDVNRSPLHRTVPGYYFRYTDGCALHNGTGVGNETASEQPMMRKYMIDSLKHWAKNYQIDGFRFDLMGIHDVDTMNEIRSALDEIDSSIIILGEGWNMGNHPAGVAGANQDNAKQMPRISFFNDKFRDTLKGPHDKLEGTGYVSGGGADNVVWDVFNLIKGSNYVRDYASAAQSVNYNEAHDNYTMYDKLKGSLPNASDEEIARRHAFATQLQFLSSGGTFVHAGQEMLRTKNGDENSYKSPDHINAIDYDRAEEFSKSVDYFRTLTKFRSDNSWVRTTAYDRIEDTVKAIHIKDGDKRLSYRVNLPGEPERVVFVNPTSDPWKVELPEGDWKVLLSDLDGALMPNPQSRDTGLHSGSVDVPGIAALVFEENRPDSEGSSEVSPGSTDDEGNEEPGSTDGEGDAEPGSADGEGNEEPGSTDGEGDAEPGSTDDEGDVEPGSTDDEGDVEPGSSDGEGDAEPGSTDGDAAQDPSVTQKPSVSEKPSGSDVAVAPTAPGKSGNLAKTGVETATLALAALVLSGIGVGAVRVARREE